MLKQTVGFVMDVGGLGGGLWNEVGMELGWSWDGSGMNLG